MRILCVFGEHNYGDPDRGIGYEYANFLAAFENLGHEVLFFESLNKSKYSSFIELNKKFLEAVEQAQPDIIFCVLMGYEIWLETLNIIRKSSKAALIHWATDDSWKYEQFSRFISPAFDLYATTYPSALDKSKSDGHTNFELTQWAANSSCFVKPLPSMHCLYDVSFVGTQYGNRKELVHKLKRYGLEVACFGYGWPAGPVSADEIPKIINQSRVSLNFGDSGLMFVGGRMVRSRQIKARVFEVPGAGGLLMTESAEHLDQFYSDGDEIMSFIDVDDLVEKIKFLLSNPQRRDEITEAGFNRTVNEHSYEMRFQNLIEKAVKMKEQNFREKVEIDYDEFEIMAAKHKMNISTKFLKSILLLPCILIWGKKRGPRAARKILFEFSWRFLDRKTYTAAGLPGRLFYEAS